MAKYNVTCFRDLSILTETWFAIRPCQIGILLNVKSSLINLGTYSQKHKQKTKTQMFYDKNNALLKMLGLYLFFKYFIPLRK